jgi:3-hydroxybutyryl-CoA dehydrogenase
MQEKLGVAGSGAIACGLAATASKFGEVLLYARSEASADKARKSLDKICGRLEGEADVANVKVVTDVADLAPATMIIEAVVEEHDPKVDLLRRIVEIAAPDAVIGTTTSSLSVTRIAEEAGAPERFVGLHVFNPVPRMKLVELAYPEQADQDVRDRAWAVCEALGKTPVNVPDTPGFVVNRLLFPYLFSAVDFLVESGMEPADVDTCMKLGAGHPMGPLALLDFVGLDVSAAIGDAIGHPAPQRVHELLAEGALGKKSGRGFYDYG